MNEPSVDLPIDDRETPVHDAFLYLKLYDRDIGETTQRTGRPEFETRRPHCVSSFSTEKLDLEITNSGEVISDLIVVEHQFVFCIASSHGPEDGFASDHSGEASSELIDALATAASVPPKGSLKLTIPVPEFVWPRLLVNLYIRCRLATIWAPSVPKEQWNFAADPRVTEAHLRVR